MCAIALITVAFLGACSPAVRAGTSTPGVSLRVLPHEVAAGDMVTLLLSNDSQSGIGYNLCTSALERRSGDAWQGLTSDRICTMELLTLGTGEQTRYPMEIPAGLAPGEYRFHTTIQLLDTRGRGELRSDPFRIRS